MVQIKRSNVHGSRSAAVLAEAARLQTRLDKLTAAAVADMQHCHPNATSGVSILHSVAEPRHRVGEAEAMAPHMCEVPLWTSTLTAP